MALYLLAVCQADRLPDWGGGNRPSPQSTSQKSEMSEAILETRELRREFGAIVAVEDVDLVVSAGSLHSIIGPNGAGKTTVFNLISGTLRPTRGQILLRGEDITGSPTHRAIHRGIGRSFQITNIFPNLTVFENVRIAAQALGKDNFKALSPHRRFGAYMDRAGVVLDLVGLSDRASVPAQVLAHGDQRKLELGMILAPDPEILMLDEPTAGMAAEQVPELIELIRNIQSSANKTVMLVEHNMQMVMGVSDCITVMHQGAVIAEGTPSEIRANQRVQTAYLGGLYTDLGGAG